MPRPLCWRPNNHNVDCDAADSVVVSQSQKQAAPVVINFWRFSLAS